MTISSSKRQTEFVHFSLRPDVCQYTMHLPNQAVRSTCFALGTLPGPKQVSSWRTLVGRLFVIRVVFLWTFKRYSVFRCIQSKAASTRLETWEWMESFCPARHCILCGVLKHFPALEQSSAEKDGCHAFVMPSAFCVARILHLQLLVFTGCEEEPCPCSSSCKCCWVPSASWRLELPSRISHWGAVRFVWRQSPGKLLLCSSDLLAGAVPSCSWGAWVCVLGNYAQSSAGHER